MESDGILCHDQIWLRKWRLHTQQYIANSPSHNPWPSLSPSQRLNDSESWEQWSAVNVISTDPGCPPTPAAQGGARKGRRVTTTTATMTTMTTTTTTATATTSTCFECCLWAFRVVSLRVFGILLQMIGLGGVSAFPVVSVGTCWDTFCTCCWSSFSSF